MSLFFLFILGLTGSESGWPHVSAVPPCPSSRSGLASLSCKVRDCMLVQSRTMPTSHWAVRASLCCCLSATVVETTLVWALIRRTFVLDGRQWKSPLAPRCVFVCVWHLNAVLLCPSEAVKSSLWFPAQFFMTVWPLWPKKHNSVILKVHVWCPVLEKSSQEDVVYRLVQLSSPLFILKVIMWCFWKTWRIRLHSCDTAEIQMVA